MNAPNSQLHIRILREDSVISLLNAFLDLTFDVSHAATGYRYSHGNDIRLVNIGLIASFCNYKRTKFSRNYLEVICHGHNVSLLYK